MGKVNCPLVETALSSTSIGLISIEAQDETMSAIFTAEALMDGSERYER